MRNENVRAEKILQSMKHALNTFYLGGTHHESEAEQADRTKKGLTGYVMALMDMGKVRFDDFTGSITLSDVPLEVLTLLPLVKGREKMIGRHTVFEAGQEVGYAIYEEPIFYWDKKDFNIFELTGLIVKYVPINPVREIEFTLKNVRSSAVTLGVPPDGGDNG